MFELVEFDIPELTNVYLIFENEEVSPVGVLKRGGLKRVANGDLRKTSSLPVDWLALHLKVELTNYYLKL